MHARAIAVLLAATACGDESASSTTGAAAGTALRTYHTSAGPIAAPLVPPAGTVATLRLADGTFTKFGGTVAGDGSLDLPNAPDGEYYLQFGTTFVVTSGRDFDLGDDVLGRDDVALPTQFPVRARIALTGMTPWQRAGDQLWLYSAGAALSLGGLHRGALDEPLGGATELDSTFLYATADNRDVPLLDGSAGDVARIYQLVLETAGDTEFRSLKRYLELSEFGGTGPQTYEFAGELSSIDTLLPAAVDWDLTSFEAHRAAVHPNAVVERHAFAESVLPEGAAAGRYGPPLDVGVLTAAPGAAAINIQFVYGYPTPDTWGGFATATTQMHVPFSISASAEPVLHPAPLRVGGPPDAFNDAPIELVVSPPVGLLLNGEAALGSRTGVTDSPTLEWEPPEVGEPELYAVRVFRLAQDGATTTSALELEILTAGVSVVVPPDLLTAGGFYYAEVEAMVDPDIDLATAPRRRSVSRSSARALTGTFSP